VGDGPRRPKGSEGVGNAEGVARGVGGSDSEVGLVRGEVEGRFAGGFDEWRQVESEARVRCPCKVVRAWHSPPVRD
jgi:hypothetical protein